jgi:nicotinate-nucleotide pyrophosphorylase (carboxylating)
MLTSVYDDILKLALREDIGTGDITTESTIAADATITGDFISRVDGVVCGTFVAARCFELVDPTIVFTPIKKEGEAVKAGESIATVSGNARSILTAERTALNMMQRMCAIATTSAYYNDLVKDYPATVVDTRKTTPGLRALEKYAVKTGGCGNHRFCLSDGVLIKDNHIKAAGGVTAAIVAARQNVPFVLKIEIECDTLEQVKESVEAGADIIMLDNMGNEAMAEAVGIIHAANKGIKTEASGNMSIPRLIEVAATGVDYISVGALTHTVKAMDISMNIQVENK